MTITLIILSVVFSILSGFFKAIMDLSEEDKLKFSNKKYWVKVVSWVNKWKCDSNGVPILVNGKRVEKRWLSSTVFVMFYDAWHLFGNFYNRSTKAIGVLIGILSALYSWYFLIGFTVTSIIHAGSFHIFYTYKILRK